MLGFQFQQGVLHGQASCVAGKFSVGADYPVTGGDDPDGISVAGHAHGPDRFFIADGNGDVLVGCSLSVRNFGKRMPDGNLKGRSF